MGDTGCDRSGPGLAAVSPVRPALRFGPGAFRWAPPCAPAPGRQRAGCPGPLARPARPRCRRIRPCGPRPSGLRPARNVSPCQGSCSPVRSARGARPPEEGARRRALRPSVRATPVRGSPARCGLPGLRPGPGVRPGGAFGPWPHGLLKDIRIPNPFPPGSAPPELPPWVPWPWPPGCARGRCLPAGPARGTPGPARGAAPGGGAPVRPVFPVPRSAGPRLPCAPAPSSARCFGARFPAFPSRQGVFMLTLIFNFN